MTNLVCRNDKSFLPNRFYGNDTLTEQSLPSNFVACMTNTFTKQVCLVSI